MQYDKLLRDPAHLQELMSLFTESITAEVQDNAVAALAVLDRAVALNPLFLPARMRRADLLLELARHAEAIAEYDDCLRFFPTLEQAVQSRQQALLLAVAHGAQALQERPNDIGLLCRQAQWQFSLERGDDALASLDCALALEPDHIDALNMRGKLLLLLNRHEQALLCYDRLLALSPADAVMMFNRGNVLQKMNHIHQAQWCYQQALVLQPEFPEAEMAHSHCLLLQADFSAGWQGHEARWRTAQLREHAQFQGAPAWLGETSLTGRHIILWAEQGLGDTLQFVRYVPVVAARAAQVTLWVPPTLQHLLAGSLATLLNVQVVSHHQELAAHDLHCPLMSLPLALRATLELIPADVPYLRADAQLRGRWAERLSTQLGVVAAPRLKVGLAWAGRQYGECNLTRDIPLRQLQALAAIELDYVSLQCEVPSADSAELQRWPKMRRLESDLIDMSQTAALIANLDLVISADTAVIHLAGALGRPAWLLLRHESEWRWGLQSGDSIWYPTLKLFRQKKNGDWAGVAEEVAACLRLLAAKP